MDVCIPTWNVPSHKSQVPWANYKQIPKPELFGHFEAITNHLGNSQPKFIKFPQIFPQFLQIYLLVATQISPQKLPKGNPLVDYL